MLNSLMASMEGATTMLLKYSSVTVAPSIRYRLCALRCPRTFTSVPACCMASPRVPPGGRTTPWLNIARSRNSLVFRGKSTICRPSTTSLISADSGWTAPLSASTTTVSLASPIWTVTSWRRLSPTCTSTFEMTDCLKFVAFTFSEYVPMGSWVSRYWPELLVVVVNFCPVWACSATTVAPGSTPPRASCTLPAISPVFICPSRQSAPSSGSSADFKTFDKLSLFQVRR